MERIVLFDGRLQTVNGLFVNVFALSKEREGRSVSFRRVKMPESRRYFKTFSIGALTAG